MDDYLTIGTSSTELGTSEGNFSVLMWVKPDTFRGTGNAGDVPLIEVGNGQALGLFVDGRPGKFGGGLAYTDNYSLYNATGKWYHLAYVFNNGVYTFYVNGEKKGSGSSGAPGAADSLRIGLALNGLYFDGLLDDLTVVQRAITASDVQAHLNRSPAINLHLDEGLKTRNGVVTAQTIFSFANESENSFSAACLSADHLSERRRQGTGPRGRDL